MASIDIAVLPTYLAVIALFLVPPGPDMAYMAAVGLEGGRSAAVRAILGIGTGMSVYAAAVVLGVGALAQAHPQFLAAVKLFGAAYLVWLAVATVRHARTSGEADDIAHGRWYRRGVMVSITNPKIMLFFLAVLPGFLGDAQNTVAQFAMLSAVNVSSEILLYGGIGLLAGGFHARFTRSRKGTAVLSVIAGTVYLGLAGVIAAESLWCSCL